MNQRFGHQPFIGGIELWSQTRDDLMAYIKKRLDGNQSVFILTLNPIMVMAMRNNAELQALANEADVIVADGRGIVWASRRLNKVKAPLVPGVELAEELIREASINSWSVILLGAQDGVWQHAKERLEKKYPGLKIVGGHHGYYKIDNEPELFDYFASLKPKIIIAGMGFPRQEKALHRNKEKFPAAVLIGVGGSLDIFSGMKKRAPTFFRRTGTEWLWRMISEPGRFKQLSILIKFWFFVWIRHFSLKNNEI